MTARLLGLWVLTPPGACKSVSCEYCVLSGIGLWLGLITYPEESYRVWCVWVWSWSLYNEAVAPRGGTLYCRFSLQTFTEIYLVSEMNLLMSRRPIDRHRLSWYAVLPGFIIQSSTFITRHIVLYLYYFCLVACDRFAFILLGASYIR